MTAFIDNSLILLMMTGCIFGFFCLFDAAIAIAKKLHERKERRRQLQLPFITKSWRD